MATKTRTAIIRQLNDELRCMKTDDMVTGSVVMTKTVMQGDYNLMARIIGRVMAFDTFTEDNDPYGEHDFGMFQEAGEDWFFKIDYYDRALESASPDPSDPTVTRRVLTIGHWSDY